MINESYHDRVSRSKREYMTDVADAVAALGLAHKADITVRTENGVRYLDFKPTVQLSFDGKVVEFKPFTLKLAWIPDVLHLVIIVDGREVDQTMFVPREVSDIAPHAMWWVWQCRHHSTQEAQACELPQGS